MAFYEERGIAGQNCLERPLSSIAFYGGEGKGEEAIKTNTNLQTATHTPFKIQVQ
jgi:hypothetical protein